MEDLTEAQLKACDDWLDELAEQAKRARRKRA